MQTGLEIKTCSFQKDIVMIPRLMQKRHSVLDLAWTTIARWGLRCPEIFYKETTIHADIELSWMNIEFQEKNIAPCSQFQIVIAKVKPGQKSQPHFHEVGTSSFIVLDCPIFLDPTGLTYRCGQLLPSGKAIITREELYPIYGKNDIFPYQVHQFENTGKYSAHILIVTHPIISIETGQEDTYFVDLFQKK